MKNKLATFKIKTVLVLQISPFASGFNMAQYSTGDKGLPGDKWQNKALNWDSKLVLILSTKT